MRALSQSPLSLKAALDLPRSGAAFSASQIRTLGMPPKKKTATPALADVLANLRKAGTLVASMDEHPALDVVGISTGNLALDLVTSVGGIPRGRITELFGLPSSGKTTTALQAAATLQQEGGTILFLDYEQSLDPVYCKALGLDTSAPSFLYARPKTFEEGANLFRDLNATGEIDLCIVDSVARMVTKSELEAETGKAVMADRAKLMHQFCRQIVGPIQDTQVGIVFLNHVLDVVDVSPMGQRMKAQGISRKTTPGGMALKFYASLRIEFKQTGNLRSEEVDPLTNEKVATVRQTKVQATVVKNKVGDPFRVANVRVRYGHGFSQEWTVLDILVNHGVLKKGTAGVYTFTEQTLPTGWEIPSKVQGEDKIIALMERDTAWTDRMIALASATLVANMETADPSRYTADGDEVDDIDLDDVLPGFAVNKETGEVL